MNTPGKFWDPFLRRLVDFQEPPYRKEYDGEFENNEKVCCNENAEWIDYGPRLQYWYCKKCKNEVK